MTRHEDPYMLLGLRRDASAADVRRAYRRAVQAAHPDRRPGDPTAARRFTVLTDAYDTLRDPARRAAYDREHPVVTHVRLRRDAAPAPVHLGARARSGARGPFGLDLRPPPAGRRPTWSRSVEEALARHAPARRAADDDLVELASLVARLLRGAGY